MRRVGGTVAVICLWLFAGGGGDSVPANDATANDATANDATANDATANDAAVWDAMLWDAPLAVVDGAPPVDAGPPDGAMPASARVLYLADGDTADIDELYLVNIMDDVPLAPVKLNHTLVAGMSVTEFAWSPDGLKVWYVADTDATPLTVRREAFVVDLTTGTPTTPVRVNADLWPDTSVVPPKWSPDSTRLAYRAQHPTRQAELYVYIVVGPAAGTRVKINTALATDAHVLDFAWSPWQGRMLAYRANQDGLGDELYVVDTSTTIPGAPVKVSPPVSGAQDVFELARHGWGWSPNGQRLFMVAEVLTTEDETIDAGAYFYVDELFIVDFSGQVPSPPVKVERNSFENLIRAYWSPDSQRIAMATYSNGFYADLSTPVPGPVYQVGHSWTDRFLLWSSDSSKLAFHGPAVPDPGAPRQLWFVDVTGGAPTTVRVNALLPSGGEVYGSSEGAWAITWTSDSSHVLYVAAQEIVSRAELYMVDVSSGSVGLPKKLNPPGGSLRDIRRYIDYHRSTSRVLYVGMDVAAAALCAHAVDISSGAPGTSSKVNGVLVPGGNVLFDDVSDLQWAWSPDGTFIAYVADQLVDQRFELFVVRMTGATPGVAIKINTTFPPGDVARFAWAP